MLSETLPDRWQRVLPDQFLTNARRYYSFQREPKVDSRSPLLCAVIDSNRTHPVRELAEGIKDRVKVTVQPLELKPSGNGSAPRVQIVAENIEAQRQFMDIWRFANYEPPFAELITAYNESKASGKPLNYTADTLRSVVAEVTSRVIATHSRRIGIR